MDQYKHRITQTLKLLLLTTHCIIEAIWVIPRKFRILKKLHPKVTWIVRDHSDIPFLSSEGNAIEWLFDYVKNGVTIASNKLETCKCLSDILKTEVLYLPNYYPVKRRWWWKGLSIDTKRKTYVDVGCFGAVRPLKNQLTQAMAAIKFAESRGRRLRFYMNTVRVEGCGGTVLKNVRALFKNSPRHKLIELPWLEYRDFLNMCKCMDVGMQVSFSETFNIVTADMVNADIPIVVSPEVYWVNHGCWADPNSIEDIVLTMKEVSEHRKQIVKQNKKNLVREDAKSMAHWVSLFGGR